jgi:hypothetical protein
MASELKSGEPFTTESFNALVNDITKLQQDVGTLNEANGDNRLVHIIKGQSNFWSSVKVVADQAVLSIDKKVKSISKTISFPTNSFPTGLVPVVVATPEQSSTTLELGVKISQVTSKDFTVTLYVPIDGETKLTKVKINYIAIGAR